ncbi:MAG: DUF4845 domain-containing protein [Marinobacter sp.]|nr:DUF4845 domain-containing protein [Marinobacter sp.]
MNKHSQHSPASQRGASTLGILVALLFFGSLLTLAIKIGPIYLDDLTIQEAVEGLNGTKGLSVMNAREVHKLINKRLTINNVRNLDPKAITVKADGNRVHINVEYEIRTGIISNIDAVVHFHHEYDMTGQ